MKISFASLSPHKLRKLLLEEAKKFNAAIKFGSPVSELEDIQMEIKGMKVLLKQKESVEKQLNTVESIPPHISHNRGNF